MIKYIKFHLMQGTVFEFERKNPLLTIDFSEPKAGRELLYCLRLFLFEEVEAQKEGIFLSLYEPMT